MSFWRPSPLRMVFARYGAAVMRRMLALCAAMVVVLTAAPAWAAEPFPVNISGAPSKIFYNVTFAFTIKYTNNTGATATNPHPYVFLGPTPNLGGHCSPGFRATMAEIGVSGTPTSEHETTGG